MKNPLLFLSLFSFAFASCDKARNIVNKARSQVESNIAKKTGKDGTTPDPELEKLVDRTAEGVIFRKDLPFPKKIEVDITNRESGKGRGIMNSEMGKSVASVSATVIETCKVEKDGDNVRFTPGETRTVEDGKEPEKDGKKEAPEGTVVPAEKPVVFRKNGSSWKADGADFRSAVLSKEIGPVFDEVLQEYFLAPRTMWFGKRRLKEGDEIKLSGEMIPMYAPGNAKGELTLKLLSFEAVEGHPCGVFSISGDLTRRNIPDFNGVFWDADQTIESGKVWFSLIYPLILREELEVIETRRSGGKGGSPSVRMQGSNKISTSVTWKKLQ